MSGIRMDEKKRLIKILNNAPIGYEKLGQRFFKHVIENIADYLFENNIIVPLIGGGGDMNTEWILKAVETIKSGIADKLTKDNITIYRVKNIIRIDIKES